MNDDRFPIKLCNNNNVQLFVEISWEFVKVDLKNRVYRFSGSVEYRFDCIYTFAEFFRHRK